MKSHFKKWLFSLPRGTLHASNPQITRISLGILDLLKNPWLAGARRVASWHISWLDRGGTNCKSSEKCFNLISSLLKLERWDHLSSAFKCTTYYSTLWVNFKSEPFALKTTFPSGFWYWFDIVPLWYKQYDMTNDIITNVILYRAF